MDIQPGSPSAGDMDDGSTLPITQTASNVTLPDILDVLNSDVRTDLQTFLHEYGTVASRAAGRRRSTGRSNPSSRPTGTARSRTTRCSAWTRTAMSSGSCAGSRRRSRRSPRTRSSLKALVTDLNTTAGAIAREDTALEAAVPALRDTLREGYPALGELNAALPTLRTFAREATPGVRSSVPALDAAIPWFTQARGLVQQSELKGLAADLRHAVPSLVKLNTRLVPFLQQLRALSSCTNHVLVPFMESDIPSIEEGNSGHSVREQINRSFVGLAGESRNVDANTPVFHIQGVNPVKLATGKLEPAPPLNSNVPPPHRPDVPCETQDPPNLKRAGRGRDPLRRRAVKVAIKKHLDRLPGDRRPGGARPGGRGVPAEPAGLPLPAGGGEAEAIQLELENAQAVQPGQGQTVRVAGVEVGRIADVKLHEGVALVTLEIKPELQEPDPPGRHARCCGRRRR